MGITDADYAITVFCPGGVAVKRGEIQGMGTRILAADAPDYSDNRSPVKRRPRRRGSSDNRICPIALSDGRAFSKSAAGTGSSVPQIGDFSSDPMPSVLILAKGEVDGPAGAWLRSGEGLQGKRLDAATLLVGDRLSRTL